MAFDRLTLPFRLTTMLPWNPGGTGTTASETPTAPGCRAIRVAGAVANIVITAMVTTSDPPPPGEYDGVHEQSRRRMKRSAIWLNAEAMRIACDAFVEKLTEKKIELSAVAITSCGYHVVGRFDDRKPRFGIGLAKKHSAFALVEAGLAQRGGVWAVRGLCKPIADERHWRNAPRYVRDHVEQGAAEWSPAGGVGASRTR